MDGDVRDEAFALLQKWIADGFCLSGFGSHMANSPMVILWQTVNGTIILSQRQATGRVEPLPVTDPPRRATVALRDDTVRLDYGPSHKMLSA